MDQKLSFKDIGDALKECGIEKLSDGDTELFNACAETPVGILEHTIASSVIQRSITVSELKDICSGVQFDFKTLENNFNKVCNDYSDALTKDGKSYSLGFAARIIFHIGPESRSVKRKDNDKNWKIKFLNPSKVQQGGKLIDVVNPGCANIATFKNDNAPNTLYQDNHKIVLSIKQAGLLAVTKLCQAVKLVCDDDTIILTPLAGACFNRDSIKEMCQITNISVPTMINIVNSSCQSGGHYLADSNINCAAASALNAVRNLKEKTVARQIVQKTIKQYLAKGHVFNRPEFEMYAKYATGGLPEELTDDNLSNDFERIKIAPRVKVAITGLTQPS